MNTKATIRKILIALLWAGVGGGMLTLLIAAIGKNNREYCSDFSIHIRNTQETYFVDKKDISVLLTTAIGRDVKGKKVSELNLRQLEELLEGNIWIRDAEIWIDNRNVLRVEVVEREPVARIFTTTGNTFYIDSSEVILPMSDKLSANVPVFTNFPERTTYSASDSQLLHSIKAMSAIISKDSFWTSQVEQVDIDPGGKFELIPLVGNHVVKMGTGTNLEKKFNRLMAFYKQVLPHSGFDYYSTVDVQYAGQVVAAPRGSAKNIVDTVKLRMNVDKLLKRMAEIEKDTVAAQKPLINDQAARTNNGQKISSQSGATSPKVANPNTMKAQSLPQENKKIPKAVMKKNKR